MVYKMRSERLARAVLSDMPMNHLLCLSPSMQKLTAVLSLVDRIQLQNALCRRACFNVRSSTAGLRSFATGVVQGSAKHTVRGRGDALYVSEPSCRLGMAM